MNTQALRKQYLESFIDYGYHRNGTWFVVFVTIHHHHPVCPLKGVRVVLTPYSTVLCRWLCPNPPLSHHPEHNPPIVFLVDPYSLFLVPYVPLPIYQALSLPFSSRVRTISVYFLKSSFSALSPSIPVLCLRFSFFLVLLRTRLYWLEDISSLPLPISSQALHLLPRSLPHKESPVLPSFCTPGAGCSKLG